MNDHSAFHCENQAPASQATLTSVGEQIADALKDATGDQPLVMTSSTTLSVFMTLRQSELLLAKLQAAS